MAQRVSQLRRGVLELAILALLGRGEMYGGEIVDNLKARSGLDSGAGTVRGDFLGGISLRPAPQVLPADTCRQEPAD